MTTQNQRAAHAGTQPMWRRFLTVVLGIGASALLLGTACPACLLAYVGMLSIPGLGLLLEHAAFMPVTVVLFGMVLGGLASHAPARRGYGPFNLGVAAVVLILTSMFGVSFVPLRYVGLATLVGASLWNVWPHQVTAPDSCAVCAPRGSGKEQMSAHQRIAS